MTTMPSGSGSGEGDLGGHMSIQTVGLAGNGGGNAEAETTATKDVVAWDYMDPKGGLKKEEDKDEGGSVKGQIRRWADRS